MTALNPVDIRVRGYISCVLGCPYEGSVDPLVVAEMAVKLREMGTTTIALLLLLVLYYSC